MKGFKHRSARLLAILLCFAARGVPAAETQQYDIELLVFQHLVNSDGGEVWHDAQTDWFDDDESGSLDTAVASVNWLGAGDYRLAPQLASLRSSSQYRPLAHLAWRQTVLDRQSAQAVRLPVTGSNVTVYVDGLVTVAVERYLHLTLNLALHTATTLPSDAALLEQTEAPIKLREQRRMRSSEIHYFDNPRFGVLAVITPYRPTP